MTKRGAPQIRLSGESRSPVQGFRIARPQIDNVYLIMDSLVTQDLRIFASHLSFGFDLTLTHLRFITSCELWHLELHFLFFLFSFFLQLIQDI
jgi:hypothetical protein